MIVIFDILDRRDFAWYACNTWFNWYNLYSCIKCIVERAELQHNHFNQFSWTPRLCKHYKRLRLGILYGSL